MILGDGSVYQANESTGTSSSSWTLVAQFQAGATAVMPQTMGELKVRYR